MWSKRLFIVIITATICAGTSLSAGPGTASADILTNIFRAVDDLAPVLIRKFGLARSEVEPLFVSTATKLTPVTDDVGLRTLKDEWTGFAPRKPTQQEVALRRGELPGAYRKAAEMLCETAGELLVTDDKTFWEFSINQVNGQIAQLHPVGRNLALYNDLNDIAGKFQSGCYCAATAKLAVVLASRAYC